MEYNRKGKYPEEDLTIDEDPYKNMEVIYTQFVHKTCTQIYSIVPNVYLMYT